MMQQYACDKSDLSPGLFLTGLSSRNLKGRYFKYENDQLFMSQFFGISSEITRKVIVVAHALFVLSCWY